MTKTDSSPSGQEYIHSLITSGKLDQYKVPRAMHFAGWVNAYCYPLIKTLSKLEDLLFDDEIDATTIDSPVYICGLARSGTTITLETLYQTGAFATHQYRDYPFIDTPILWNKWQDLLGTSKEQERERAHFDGIKITPHSPEAFEEMIWMKFFPDCHNPEKTNLIDKSYACPKFEKHYKTHIKKLLWQRKGKRYLAKGNYNLTRISYLHKIFPDAKFIILLRDPVDHVLSLIKQHSLFTTIEQKDKKAQSYMKWAGHYEFGNNRAPINIGDNTAIVNIQEQWHSGNEIKGWALYWDMLHRWLDETLEADAGLRSCVKIIDYETLCQSPLSQISSILEHCDVPTTEQDCKGLSERIKKPEYYKTSFTDKEIQTIRNLTDKTYQDVLKRTS